MSYGDGCYDLMYDTLMRCQKVIALHVRSIWRVDGYAAIVA